MCQPLSFPTSLLRALVPVSLRKSISFHLVKQLEYCVFWNIMYTSAADKAPVFNSLKDTG